MSGKIGLLNLIALVFLTGCISVKNTPIAAPQEKIHRVKRGETLAKISSRFQLPLQHVAARNKISDPNEIEVGQILIIPKSRPVARKRRNRGAKVGGLLFGGKGFRWPVKGQISSNFGMRNGRPHEGVDIRAPKGRAIRSIHRGKVSFVGWKNGYGRTVIIDHGKYSSLYAHLNRFKVKKNQYLDAGQILGTVGASGRASGPHLHFEIRRGKRAINPISFYQAKL